MANVLYTARAHVTGGRISGHGKTSDGELEVDIRVPKELGGEGGGTNPEELFAIGYAACFEGALATVARRAKAEALDAAIEAQVQLVTTGERGAAPAVPTWPLAFTGGHTCSQVPVHVGVVPWSASKR